METDYLVFNEAKHPIKAWVRGVEVEEEAKKQLFNLAELPFIHKHIAVLPDVHFGMGSTVGSVIPTIGAIIPAAVGVDIGCGMEAFKTNLKAEDLPTNLKSWRTAIENAVPHGRTDNGGSGDYGAWHDIPENVKQIWFFNLEKEFTKIIDRNPQAKGKNVINHLGTLGTGNHFIEICLDENNDVWIMLHSGSRGIGNRFGQYFIELAKEDMRKFYINLPDMNLAYLPEGTEHFNDYWQAVLWAQNFAKWNRKIMMSNLITRLNKDCNANIEYSNSLADIVIDCHHNYVTRENHFGKNIFVTRKGAVRARLGDLGIIPGSMGTKSYIVRGLGNAESFTSCSHGAGRRMSRTQARKLYTIEDQVKATEGVECRKDIDVIDEIPMAYKDVDAVMKAQENLVEILHTLKGIVCVKG